MKTTLPLSLLMLLTVILTPGAKAQSAPQTFVKFDAFLKTVASADASTYLLSSESRVVSRSAFEEMRQHVLSLYNGVQVTHSFVYNGQHVDCVPILQQPGARRLGLRAIPPKAPHPVLPVGMAMPPATPSPFASGRSDEFGNQLLCEDGTIPMRRITFDELSRFPTLADYFRKAPGSGYPAPAVDYAGYRHRALGISPTNIGASSQFELWYPSVNTSLGQVHSLSQMWVLGHGGPSVLQTAEAGWQVAPQHYNTSAAVPFIYWTADAYIHSGCYNLECAGFIQTSNALVLGVPNWPAPSQPGGQQVIFSLQYQGVELQDGTLAQWELYYNCTPQTMYTCAIGYYPIYIYGAGQLSRHSDELNFGGETYSSTHTVFGEMGSGALPSGGPQYAAYQSNVYYVTSWYNGSYYVPYAVNANLSYLNSPQADACYGELCPAQFCNAFYFGGPGGTNCQ